MKKIWIAVFMAAVSVLPYACNSSKNGTTTKNNTPKEETIGEAGTGTLVNFVVTDQLSAIMEKAKKENKVVFIDFFTTWCAPCRLMDQSVFSDEDVASYMNQNCLSMKINAEKGEGVALKVQFGVNAYPTYIFIDGEGNEVVKKTGSLSIEEFKKLMKTGVWKVKNPAGQP